MTPRAVSSRHALESCTLQLHSWRPFDSSKPYTLHAKKPCRSDRSTAPDAPLLDDPTPPTPYENFRWIAGKRRRRRSVSGRSSDRSGTRRASAACATCSDFPLVAGGTDSSGELFANGDASWGSDASEVQGSRRDAREVESSASVSGLGIGVSESQGNSESGYVSEPGYRGDAELGYGDEFDEEEDEGRPLFWGDRFGGGGGDPMEIVGENKFADQKSHHRGRRKKQQQDWRMISPLK